ncbi:MAG: DUF4340 domain-containing protein [Bacteroidales bacterium]|jgi:hypothetical protein|nr:DUF4340 domain-containing protein [Bacteroidales bacterium]
MKRQKVYFIVALLLAILSITVIVYKKVDFKKSENSLKLSTVFAISDTSTITRIFIADMYENQVLLSKTEQGWIVNNQRPGSVFKIKDLIITLNSLQVLQPVAKPAQQSVIDMLAVSSTKVEVYAKQPLFQLFGYSFFIKERLIKTYFLGDATQTNLGSYALLQGMSEPYIIYKPGFRGFVTPLFSPNPIDWFSPRIFGTKLTRIQTASFIDIENPNNTFFVEKAGPRSFSLYDFQKNLILDYDTTLLINMLSEFRERNYEMFLSKISQSDKDSILQNFFKIISITDIDNQTTTLKLYHLIDTGSLYEDGDLVDEIYQEYNRDRCYATINDYTDEIYTVQFFHFDRQIQPLSYFIKR